MVDNSKNEFYITLYTTFTERHSHMFFFSEEMLRTKNSFRSQHMRLAEGGQIVYV